MKKKRRLEKHERKIKDEGGKRKVDTRSEGRKE